MHFWLCSGQEEQEGLDPWLETDGAMLVYDKEEGNNPSPCGFCNFHQEE